KEAEVILFDMSPPSLEVPEGIVMAVTGMDCVFHSSYVMSVRDQLIRKLIEEVNVQGTEHVLRACVEAGSVAEMAVMKASGTELKDGTGVLKDGTGVLRACALHPAGIYGPGEQRHLPRIVGYIEKGIFRFVYGDPRSLVEFVHVDILVSPHELAAEALMSEHQHRSAGQAYFISDGRPVNNFEFFRPLVEDLSYSFPKLRLALSLIYFVAFLTEMIHHLFGPIYNFQPLLTRTEVYKTMSVGTNKIWSHFKLSTTYKGFLKHT
uniref:Short chain dehydrogenase/reductase family 42E, member 1 n=1 Tax=Oncorhynchus mykiss TaxID=8022 RepID=A0A8C7TNM9_ONCMY